MSVTDHVRRVASRLPQQARNPDQRSRPGALHLAPLAQRRVHRRRAAHPRRPVADPAHPEIRALFVDDAPDGWLAMLEATLAYGVSRQTIMQRVKDGRLRAVHVRTGRRKGLRIEPPAAQDGLF